MSPRWLHMGDPEWLSLGRSGRCWRPRLGEGYRKVWARLRWRGVRTSKARVLRLMRAAALLAPTRVGHAHGAPAHDGTISRDAPEQMWGWMPRAM